MLRFEFQEELAVLEDDYKKLYNGVKGVSVILPTIMIVVYDKNGNTAKFFYDTLSYYEEPDNRKKLEEKGIEPWEASLSDPFKPFREGFTITIDLDKVSMVKDPRFTDKQPRKLPSIGQSCEATFTQPYWYELYDQRYNPPGGWMTHIDGEDWKAASAWYTFAEKYGSAYYYRTDLYNRASALTETQRMLGFGEGTMEELLNRLGYPELDWIDTMNKYKNVTLQVPWIMARLYISPEYQGKVITEVSLYATTTKTYRHGWSFRGMLVTGVSLHSSTIVNKPVSTASNRTVMVIVPQEYTYLGDGYIVDYEVNRVYVGSCSYWQVIPYTLFVPRYTVTSYFNEVDDVKCSGDCNNSTINNALNNLQYSTNVSVLLDDIIDITMSGPVLEDTSSVALSYELSGSIVNIFKEWIEFLLERIFGRYNPVYGFMTGLVMDKFSYTNYLYKDQGVDYVMKVASDYNLEDVYVRIEKYTGKVIASFDPYGDLVPLHISYKVYVGVYPDPPCGPYCPRGDG